MPYRLLVDMEVVDLLSALPATKRRRLCAHFRRIQTYPANCSESVEPDDEGRPLNVCLFGGFQIRYWIDDADRHIKILQIVQND